MSKDAKPTPDMPPILYDRKAQVAALYRFGEEDHLKQALGDSILHTGISKRLIKDTVRPHQEVLNSSEKATNIRSAKEEFLRIFIPSPLMSKPDGSSFHKLVYAINHSETVIICRDIMWPQIWNIDPEEPQEHLTGKQEHIHAFVVEHDWAAALSNSDIGKQEFTLPYDACCFEFVIRNKRVCVLAFNEKRHSYGIVIAPFVRLSVGWSLWTEAFYGPNSKMVWGQAEQFPGAMASGDFNAFIGDQIRAICISLEAEITETTVVRAPYRLNAARGRRDQIPLFDYHVVSLSRRGRPSRLAAEDGHEPSHRVRLHFRRGHWRHFESSKTWIKWTLVGDPDLGFVDKHYRL